MRIKHIFKTTGAQMATDAGVIKDRGLKKIISPFFSDKKEIETFIKKCLKKNQTRWMLNRLRWFVEMADYQKNHSVKLFFLIAMAETNIKLLERRFGDNDQETPDVKKFFALLPKEDKAVLSMAFYSTDEMLNKHYFRFSTIVNILLNARHRLVHGKNHYEFNFYNGKADVLNYVHGEIGPRRKKRKIMYELLLTYKSFRKLMISGALMNIKSITN